MRRALLVPALLVAAFASAVYAQDDAGIIAAGSAKIIHDPDTMRLRVDVRTDAKDLKDALAALKARRDAIKDKLIKLGAVEKSIVIEAIHTPDPALDAQRRAYASMRGGRPAPAVANTAITFTFEVRADWPLAGADLDARFLAANDIQKKIRDAKLFDNPNKTEEEEELAGMDMDQTAPTKPGEPTFYYIVHLTADEVAKSSAEAFTKARAAAERSAAAANLTLTTPRVIRSYVGDSNSSNYDNYYGPYGPIQRPTVTADKDSPNPEAVSTFFGPVTYTVNMQISYNFAAK